MDKFFKRSLLGAAVAAAALTAPAHAYKIGDANDMNVEVYGVMAISLVNYDVDGADEQQGPVFENESRVGFRAGKEMVPGVSVFGQIESGYVDNFDWGHADESGPQASGVLGFRDTFIGMSGDFGKVRFGRMLTPMYELIDWPYANPGLGASWDWGGDVAYYGDRQSNSIRYDSNQLGSINFSVAIGRDDDAQKNAQGSSGAATSDSYWYGAKATFKATDGLTLHAGLEAADKFRGTNSDTIGYLVGFESSLPGGFGLSGAYKWGENDDGQTKADQGSYSFIGQYWTGPWGFKLGYTANLDSEKDGVGQDDSDSIVSAQAMYVVNGFVPYLRVANRDINDTETFVVRLGLEYGF